MLEHAQGTPLSSGYGCGYMSLDLLSAAVYPRVGVWMLVYCVKSPLLQG